MIEILICSLFTNVTIYGCGYIFSNSLLLKKNKITISSLFYVYFFGTIILSFIALFINFFFPLSSVVNSILYILIFFLFLIKSKVTFNKKEIKFLIISSIITFLLIIYSNVNRPDAGLYHLPYVSILNDYKIIFGIANIHYRFGHISIMQYLSAVNKNFFFPTESITIPLASIISFFYIYFFNNILRVFKRKDSINSEKFFSLFILIYIAYKISNYSNFGNDIVGNVSFFYLISIILSSNLNKIDLNKILITSVFIFLNKTILGVVLLVPILIFCIQQKLNIKKLFLTLISFPSLFLYLWLLKNIIVSGCVIFPLKISCFEKLQWTNSEKIIHARLEGEAWSKAWPDRLNKNISEVNYIKDLNWINTWSNTHLKKILEILFPYLIIIFSTTILFLKKNKKVFIKISHYKKTINSYNVAVFICIIGLISFFQFPLYRFSFSYAISFIALFFIFFLKQKNFDYYNVNIFKFFFILCAFVIISKQLYRVYNIETFGEPWPKIYDFVTNKSSVKEKKFISEKFFYYFSNKGDTLCMYGYSPCSNYLIEKNTEYKKLYSYSFIVLSK